MKIKLLQIIFGLAQILDGIICVVSFGTILTHFAIRMGAIISRQRHKARMEAMRWRGKTNIT